MIRANDELHCLIKLGVLPPKAYIRQFVWFCHDICHRNLAIAIKRLRAHRKGQSVDGSLRTIPPPWIHVGNPQFAKEIVKNAEG